MKEVTYTLTGVSNAGGGVKVLLTRLQQKVSSCLPLAESSSWVGNCKRSLDKVTYRFPLFTIN